MKRVFLFSAACLVVLALRSQQPASGSANIFLGLKKMNVLGSVLYIAAHPDDENTRLLTYLSKDKLYRTGYLSLTRGDGGQNLIGDEQGIALGLIRTQELLAARRVDGAEQFFTRAFDFGYSKTPAETFAKWDKEKILADVVWVIRKFQPDVIITRFPTTGEGGHGHHTGSAILANEAFSAAADPNRFPEQLRYVKAWQAKRILWNSFGASTQTDIFKLDVGGFNPVLGRSYGEIAAESRSQHKSQGFGVASSRGEAFEQFRTTGGTPPVQDLMDSVNTSWSRVPGAQGTERMVASLIDSFSFERPYRSVPGLIKLYTAIRQLPDGYWKTQKIAEVRTLIEQASGIWLECYASQPYVAQGDSLRLNFWVNDRAAIGIRLDGIGVETFDSSFALRLQPNRNFSFSREVSLFPATPITQPYWLQKPMREGYFDIADQMQVGQPDVEPSLTAFFRLTILNEEFLISRPVRYKFTDQVKGEQNQPLTVVPAVSVYAHPELLLLKKSEQEQKALRVQATANKVIDYNQALIQVELPADKRSGSHGKGLLNKGQSLNHDFTLKAGEFARDPVRALPSIKIDTAPVNNLALANIRYDHIPYINYFYTDWVKLVPVDLQTKGRRIGYITGAGDRVPEALEQMGYEVTLLTEKEMERVDLKSFDAVLSGVRAFNTNEWMSRYHEKLMKYVEGGGNYIVQYSQANNLRAKMGPYPFSLSSKRITDENAPVSFLVPDHPILNYPNKIGPDDFKGWVQERSIYHAGSLDANYQPILRMSDPGEQPDDGALVVSRYGKGYFTYTGLAFFRQLPSGVPGAYRLLANLIALNQKKTL
ncbi:MAG TPA: PIG-L family deacetylase [Flavisolibacter sp.]|nr:PIG-L family deacetylase [Flavisolibacter sp.]